MSLVGVDIGGTWLRAAVVSAEGEVHGLARCPVGDRSVDGVLADVAGLLAKLGAQEVQRIGFAVAGHVLIADGVVAVAPNLGWRDAPFADRARARFEAPSIVVNDVDAAVWGERAAGCARGFDHVLMVAIGSGLGAGMIEDGRLIRGGAGLAGELGHIKVDGDARLCGCGEHGCLETYVGGHALAARATEAIGAGRSSRISELSRGEAVTAEHLQQAHEDGDALAGELLEEAGRRAGRAIANLCTVLAPAALVLGGGMLRGMPLVRERIVAAVSRDTAGPARAHLRILDSALGDEAGLVGAALLAGAA